ncbi:MAG: hypothetical protein RL412_316 [Pseudomonadota bacterium]|jgi:AsmA family
MTESEPSHTAARRLPAVLMVGGLIVLTLFLVLPIATVLLRQPIVNSDPVRAEIAEIMRRLTGRNVVMEGDIVIEDFPWITVIVGPGTLSNPEGFNGPPLLSWRRITLKFHYSTLYEPEPLLGPILVEGLLAEPRIDRSGRNNFSDLGPLDDTGPPEAALAIPRIELRDAVIRYTDESISSDPLLTLEKIRLTVDKLGRGAGPIDGRQFAIASINLESGVHTSRSLGLQVDSTLEARLTAIDLSTPEAADASVNIDEAMLRLGTLQASLKNIVASPQVAHSTLEVQPIAIDALMRSAGIDSPFRSRPNLFQLKQLSAKLAYADGILSAEKITLWMDDSRLSGSVRLEDPIHLAVDVDQIDFERYAAALEGGGGYDPDAPLIFPGKLLRSLPLDGRIRFGKISARGANLVGVSLRMESTPADAPAPR